MEVRLNHADVEKLQARLNQCAAAIAGSETTHHLRVAGAELLRACSSALQAAITVLEPPAPAPEDADEGE